MKVSIVIPARNEEKNLPELLGKIRDLYGNKYELIVVDDGSKDNTYNIAKKYADKIIRNERNGGKGFALRRGFEAAAGDIIVDMDADLSHKPEDIPALLKPLESKSVGMVIASRSLGGSEEYTFFRVFGNILITGLCNLWLGTKVFDSINGFRAFRKEIAKGLKCNGFEIEIELDAHALKKGYKIVEVASQEKARLKGKANSRAIRDGWRFMQQILIEGLKLKFEKF